MNKNNQVIALLTDALSNVAAERKEAAIQNIASVIRLVNETTTPSVTTPKVARVAPRRGRPKGSKNKVNARLSAENVQAVNERLSNGVPVAKIAKELGFQYHTIYAYETKRRKALAKATAN